MGKRTAVRVGVLLLALSSTATAIAGELDAFETDATGPAPEEPAPARRHWGRRPCKGLVSALTPDDEVDEVCLTALHVTLITLYGGLHSCERISDQPELHITPRAPGEALIPFVRMDVNYHPIGRDLTAWDYRGEAGWGPIAFSARLTQYDEEAPHDELDMLQLYGLYRMSFGRYVEVDLGFGTLALHGNGHRDGFAFTMPVLVHPWDWLGVECRPVWCTIDQNRIHDNDLAVLVGGPYASLRLGYRWVYTRDTSLDGPHVGVSLRW
ncbi:MAG: hypothetical protein JXR37_11410 [Kiritimatiellae bacterium]|nr:hypothetical protein [Kiritimatiellia bacterium]